VTKNKKKVLIITYYWPPSGGSGVQRWLKFVKYLPQFGWEPYVFTPQNPAFAIQDHSLLRNVPEEAEVIHFPIWEPYETFFSLSRWFGKRKGGKPVDFVSRKDPSLIKKITIWLRGNLIVPDPRIFWVRPSVKFLHDFLSDNHIDKVITTGPPHSIHLIGYFLKKKNHRLVWLADFRDPWSQWGLLDSLRVSGPVRNVHRRLEQKVLTRADIVTTITPFYVRQFEKLGKRKVDLLTNGYDEDDFRELKIVRNEKFLIRHVGIVNEKCDPRPFMTALATLITGSDEFAADVRVEFIGEVHSDFRAFVTKNDVLEPVTTFTPTMPHKELLSIYGSSSLLLLVLEGYRDAEGYMPGKLFEYLATGLPILGVGPVNGDAGYLLQESGAGKMASGSDTKGICDVVMDSYRLWKTDMPVGTGRSAPEVFTRKSITGKLIALLDRQVRL
jgi:glycosyltransferase involved in cell wall biosynthesis